MSLLFMIPSINHIQQHYSSTIFFDAKPKHESTSTLIPILMSQPQQKPSQSTTSNNLIVQIAPNRPQPNSI